MKFIGKVIKYLFIGFLGLLAIGWLASDDSNDCLSQNNNLITTMAKQEVEALAKYDIVDVDGYYAGQEIIKNDTIKKVSVTLMSKNGFGAMASNSFTVRYYLRGCDFGLLDVKKN
mgnify:CR=1 FL=1